MLKSSSHLQPNRLGEATIALPLRVQLRGALELAQQHGLWGAAGIQRVARNKDWFPRLGPADGKGVTPESLAGRARIRARPLVCLL